MVVVEVPPDAWYSGSGQRAWLAFSGGTPVGVLALHTSHPTDSGVVPAAIIGMVYLDPDHRGGGIAARLLHVVRDAMAPETLRYDGMRSEDGATFVAKHAIPMCKCGRCTITEFSRSDAAARGREELARAVRAWTAGPAGS